LQFEKDDRINGWSPMSRIALADQIMDKREIQGPLQMAIEMVLGNELL
jgi:hypothetical protein